MTHLRTRGLKLPLIGLIGLGSLGGAMRLLRTRSKRRLTAAELLRLDDEGFAAFIHAKGLRTATELSARPGTAD